MVGRMTHAAWAAAWILLAPAPVLPAAAEESWVPVLRQALAEKKCDLSQILWTRYVPVGSLVALEGRVRCADGREFDFTRPRPHMKIDVQLCQPTVC